MTRAALITPFLLLAALPLLAMPAPSKAAEPAPIASVDPVGMILRSYQKEAAFVGRTKEGTGYVIMSLNRAYLVKAQPGGIVRIVPCEPKVAQDLMRSAGWAL